MGAEAIHPISKARIATIGQLFLNARSHRSNYLAGHIVSERIAGSLLARGLYGSPFIRRL